MRKGIATAWTASLLLVACGKVHEDAANEETPVQRAPATGAGEVSSLGGPGGSAFGDPPESSAVDAGTMDADSEEWLGADATLGADAALDTDAAPDIDASRGADATLGIDAAPGTDAAPDTDTALGADMCTDAESDGESDDSGSESGTPTRTNVGAACASGSDCGCRTDCVVAQSLSDLGVATVVRYAEGYCTAACKETAECGSEAKCPFGDAFGRVDIPAQYGVAISALLETTSYCYKLCTTPDDCRTGYQCSTASAMLAGASAGALAGAADFARSVLQGAAEKYCLPYGSSLSNP